MLYFMETSVKFLLKFGSEQNIKNLFEKGEIYMNTIKTFKAYDAKGIGDKYEGITKILNPSQSTITFNFPNNPITINPIKLQLWETPKEHIGNIYSTYAISDQLVKRKVSHKVDPRMQIFGSHCVLIKDVMGFFEGIFSELDKQKITYSHNLVTYYDYKKLNHKLSYFSKSHLLSYQKEHRILAKTQEEFPLKFEIGSIQNISEIYSTRDILESLVVKRG